MSAPKNLFEKYLQLELQAVFQEQNVKATVVLGEDDEITILPRLVVNDIGGPEGVFETGIYQHTVEFIAKTSSVGETTDDTAEANRQLLGQVLDVLQLVDLADRLTASGNLYLTKPTGIVLGLTHPLEVGEKMWIRKVECEFIGFSKALG